MTHRLRHAGRQEKPVQLEDDVCTTRLEKERMRRAYFWAGVSEESTKLPR